jgi:condensin complex subunit 1
MGVRKMVHKIWDKDAGEKEAGSIREVLITSFYDIHMDPPKTDQPVELLIARNLIHLVGSMDLSELTSLEELMSTMARENRIPESLPDTLWQIFSTKDKTVEIEQKKDALILLGMIGKSNKEAILDKLDVLTRIGLGELSSQNFEVPKYACIALQQLYHAPRQKGTTSTILERLSMQHPTCERIISLLENPSDSLHWFSMAEQGINALYCISEHPDILCGNLIKVLADRIFAIPKSPEESLLELTREMEEANLEELRFDEGQQTGNKDSSLLLAQLIFVVGHIAIKQIVHLELIESEWKKRKNSKDSEKSKGSNDLEMVTGTAEDEFVDCIGMVRERELLFGPNSILSCFGSMIVHVCTHNQSFKNQILQVMATVSLCKFMCVSSDFCEAHLQLLFTILERSQNPLIRSNIIIGVGDLTICFNSLIDQNISYLYNRLKDSDFHVKKNTLMVLTFLILNGMIKVKGQISEMARCTEDEDERIRNISRAFFKELSTKDNAIYNNLPDIISNLSSVEEEQYHRIVKFLFSFITKEKQSESIVEKLCLRFKHASNERQWRDIGLCLSFLSFGTEKSFKKLVEYLPLYQDKLYEDGLYKSLLEIASGQSKSGKQEFKAMMDDFKQLLIDSREKAVENYRAANDAKSKSPVKLSVPVLDFTEDAPPDAELDQEEPNDEILEEEVQHTRSEVANFSDATLTDDENVIAPVIPKKKSAKKVPPKKQKVTTTTKRYCILTQVVETKSYCGFRR